MWLAGYQVNMQNVLAICQSGQALSASKFPTLSRFDQSAAEAGSYHATLPPEIICRYLLVKSDVTRFSAKPIPGPNTPKVKSKS